MTSRSGLVSNLVAAINRLVKVVLVVGGLAGAMCAVSAMALPSVLDPYHYCNSGFSRAVSCSYRYSSRSTHQGTPVFPPAADAAPREPQPDTIDVTSWAVAHCPRNGIARQMLCAPTSVAAASPGEGDDHTTGLPLPRPWLLTTAKTSALIEALHVETPLGVAEALRFYRAELGKRGWTEDDGAVVAPDRAVVAFATPDGPALLRIASAGDRTNADLSRRKPGATNPNMLPKQGQAMLMLGNALEEAVVITVNERSVELAALAGDHLTNDADVALKLPDSQKMDLAPGRYKVAMKAAGGAAENREFEIAAGETWGLMAGKDGVPFPVHLY